VAEVVFAYGRAADELLVGNWDANGGDSFIVRRGNVYHVANSLETGPAEYAFGYGVAADDVYVGDWDGDGYDTLTVRR